MLNDFADSKVTVKKAELLETIKTNHITHRKEHTEAVEGYRAKVIVRLETTLAGIKNGGNFDPHELLTLREPESHDKDYIRAIRMLEMSVADEVTISASQFAQFVLDDWAWKTEFHSTNALYNGKGARR